MLEGSAPIGTVTFLFSDIEGSTKLWDAHPKEMQIALAQHDQLLRQLIAEGSGFTFKTLGDAFCAAFGVARNAVETATAIQLALSKTEWPTPSPIKVRIAIHTGAVECRDEDYFGPPLNRVARLLSTAHGGQVVLSQASYELVRDSLASPTELWDLGEHQLKDLERPEQVYQVSHPGLQDQFPPLRSLTTFPNNLPQQVTSFIGREKEITHIKQSLERDRLITLTGSGGTGKTRISLQAAAMVLDRFQDGAWFVELAPISDPAFVAQAIAVALGIPEQSATSTSQLIVDKLENLEVLLILDNCEHVLAEVARIADLILKRCPRTRILASSREPLGIFGEHIYRVPSLSTPDPKVRQTVETLSHFEAVRLFIDRAMMAKNDFSVTNNNAPALASLCHRLDGIPLAIELAAARTRALSIEQIESKLDQRFNLLTSGSRTALPRQQTLRALVDWSYDLLNDSEKLLLARVSVFADTWSLENAERVCSGEGIEEYEVLDLLTSLADKSLLTTDQSTTETRFGLLETVRQYAAERLAQMGDADIRRARHRECFWMVLCSLKQGIYYEEPEAMAQVDPIYPDLRLAIRHAIEFNPSLAAEMVLRFWRYWIFRGKMREALQTCQLVRESVESNGADTVAKARALMILGNATYLTANYSAALPLVQQAFDLSKETDDEELHVFSRFALANVCSFLPTERERAKAIYEEVVSMFRAQGDSIGTARAEMNMAVNVAEDDPARGIELYNEALSNLERKDMKRHISVCLGNIGLCYEQLNEYPVAIDYHSRALKMRVEMHEVPAIAGSLESIVRCLHGLGLKDSTWKELILISAVAARLRDETGTTSEEADSRDGLVEEYGSIDEEANLLRHWDESARLPMTEAVLVAQRLLDNLEQLATK